MSKALVCLPTLNEQQSIARMISQVKALGVDVVVCDAGSTDGTVDIAKQMGVPIILRDKPGKGAGVQKTLKYAQREGYEVLVLIDCDETYPVQDIPKLLANADRYQMVVGVRNPRQVVRINAIGNHGFMLLINFLFKGKLTDVHSGMRALHVNTFLPLIDAENFDVEAQISCLTLKHRIPYLEVPIEYFERKGESKFNYIAGFGILWRILKERLR